VTISFRNVIPLYISTSPKRKLKNNMMPLTTFKAIMKCMSMPVNDIDIDIGKGDIDQKLTILTCYG